MNVPVGPTTKGGIGAAALAFVSAGIVYLTGDHTAQSVTAVELAGGGFALAIVVAGGRYAQAIAQHFGIGKLLPPLVPLETGTAGDPPAGVETDPEVLRQAGVPPATE